MNRQHLLIRIFYYTVVIGTVAAAIGAVMLLFVPLLASILLTFLLEPLVNYLEMRGLKRMTVVVGLCLVATGIVAVVVLLAVPAVAREIEQIHASVPQYKQAAAQLVATVQAAVQQRFPNTNVPNLYTLAASRLSSLVKFDMGAILGAASNLFGVLAIAGLVPVITFLLLLDGHLIQKAFLRLVPNRYFEMFVLLLHKIATSLRQFIRGQLIDALAVGVLTSIGLACIGFPGFLLVGAVAGAGNLIPYLGPVIGFVPALLILVIEGFTPGGFLMLAGVFVVVQFVEGTFVYPIAVGQSVNLHPLIVILGITVGGQVGGILGMLVAIPFISVSKVTLEVLHSNLKSYSII